LEDFGQTGNNKGRSPRHSNSRFEHNRALLERSTQECEKVKTEKEMPGTRITTGFVNAGQMIAD
jgi:hypothetical protein